MNQHGIWEYFCCQKLGFDNATMLILIMLFSFCVSLRNCLRSPAACDGSRSLKKGFFTDELHLLGWRSSQLQESLACSMFLSSTWADMAWKMGETPKRLGCENHSRTVNLGERIHMNSWAYLGPTSTATQRWLIHSFKVVLLKISCHE